MESRNDREPVPAGQDQASSNEAMLRQVLANEIEASSQRAVAREVGISGTTLSQWLRGKYTGDNAAVLAKVQTWHNSREAGIAAAIPGAPRWVKTPTGQRIEKALQFAQNEATMALVYGGAGVGKTTAANRHARTNPNVWVVTATPSSAGLASTLEDIAAAMDIRGLPNRPSAISRAIVQRMTGTRGLLVIDEAQHLDVRALEELRSIHDASGVGIALCGNESVYSRMTGGSRKATFAQLFSRIGWRLALKHPTDADVEAVLAACQIEGEAETDFALQVASLPGALRGLAHMLRQAAMAAAGGGRPVTVADMRAAHRDLGGAT